MTLQIKKEMLTPEIFLHNLKSPAIRKGERYDNEVLANWNRMQPCAICGAEPPNDNSHTVKKGRAGNNASQIFALPLCRIHHFEYETLSIEKYAELYPNLFEIVTRNIERWASEFTGLNEPQIIRHPAKSKPLKKQDSIFKKVKGSKLEKCKECLFKSEPSDLVRHRVQCSHAAEDK